MMGHIDNEDTAGIIPRLCRDMFLAIQAAKSRVSDRCEDGSGSAVSSEGNAEVSAEQAELDNMLIMDASIRVSYFEVYNERIHDLLAADPSLPCKVREHPTSGEWRHR